MARVSSDPYGGFQAGDSAVAPFKELGVPH